MEQYTTRPGVTTSNRRYMDFYMKCWRLISMGSRKDSNPIRYWGFSFMVVVSNAALITFMYMHIFTHAADIDGIAEIVDFATVFTAGLFRFVHAFFNRRKYDELVETIHEYYIHESIGKGGKLTMDKYIKISKIVSYSYMALVTFWVIQMTFTGMVYKIFTQNTKGPVVLFRVDVPYDECTQVGTALTYFIHSTSYYTMALVYCFGDAYWFVVLMLTTAQFDLISHSLRSLASSEEEEKQQESDMELNYVEHVVTSSLSHHQLLRRCVRMIENLLNPIVLVDFLHATISITFILFDMTIAISQLSMMKVINLLGYFLLSVVHMWILDYLGNRLTVKEEEISRAIYEIPWYKYSTRLRSEILMATMLASNPYKLTGGKFFHLSLEFYGKSMRTIFSYFTVLLQLRGT